MKTAEILGMKIGQFAQKHHLLGTPGSTELAKLVGEAYAAGLDDGSRIEKERSRKYGNKGNGQ